MRDGNDRATGQVMQDTRSPSPARRQEPSGSDSLLREGVLARVTLPQLGEENSVLRVLCLAVPGCSVPASQLLQCQIVPLVSPSASIPSIGLPPRSSRWSGEQARSQKRREHFRGDPGICSIWRDYRVPKGTVLVAAVQANGTAPFTAALLPSPRGCFAS